MTNTLTETASELIHEQFTTAYAARNSVDAWDIDIRIKTPAHTAMLDTLAARNIHYSVRYMQPIPDSEGGASSYYEDAYGRDYHEFSGLSGKYVIARFTVAMDEIVKYVERELE